MIVQAEEFTTTNSGAETMSTTETPAETLARIQSTVSKNDFAAIVQFANCGIHPNDITPRVNVLTFKAWKALGRRVAKGATGQKVCVWVPVEKAGKPDGVRPITAVLFHETQTIAEGAEKGTRPAAWENVQLVKAGTYDAAQEPTEETPEPAVVREPQQTDAAAEAKAFNRFARMMEPVWASAEPVPTPTAAPANARKQLAMF